MTIDPKTLKPGGKVDLTLKDGSKVVGANLCKFGSGLTTLSGLIIVVHGDGLLNVHIASVDAYTPPEPAWAKHRFCLATNPQSGWHIWEKTSDGRWWCVSEKQEKLSTEELDQKYEGRIVALVEEKEGKQP